MRAGIFGVLMRNPNHNSLENGVVGSTRVDGVVGSTRVDGVVGPTRIDGVVGSTRVDPTKPGLPCAWCPHFEETRVRDSLSLSCRAYWS